MSLKQRSCPSCGLLREETGGTWVRSRYRNQRVWRCSVCRERAAKFRELKAAGMEEKQAWKIAHHRP